MAAVNNKIALMWAGEPTVSFHYETRNRAVDVIAFEWDKSGRRTESKATFDRSEIPQLIAWLQSIAEESE